MKRLANYFFQGLLFLVPIGLTLWVVTSVFLGIDRGIQGLVGTAIPGLGFVIMLGMVVTIGFLASNFVTRRVLGLFNGLMERLPLIKIIYNALRDLMNAFVGNEKKFNKPVIVDLTPDGHVRALGFVTRETLEGLGLPDSVAVYFPQAYNFAGQLIVVPRTAIKAVPQESGEIMAFIVSGGVTGRETRNVPVVPG
jgi:uncharacterized membrane protein